MPTLKPPSQKEIARSTRLEKFIKEWLGKKNQRYLDVLPGDDEDTNGLVQIASEHMVHRFLKMDNPQDLANILVSRYALEYPKSEALKLCLYVRCRELERAVKHLVEKAEGDLLDCEDTKYLASELLQPEHKGAEFDEYICPGLVPFEGEDTATWEFRASVYLLSDMLFDRQQVLIDKFEA